MRVCMSRRLIEENAEMSEFALWFLRACDRAGLNQSRVSELAGLDRSYVNRLLNSYKPAYRYYKRPSYEKTLAIGQVLRDIRGAMQAAGRLDEYEQRTGNGIPEIEYELAPSERVLIEHYRGSDEAGRSIAQSTLEAASRVSRAGAVGGKRAE